MITAAVGILGAGAVSAAEFEAAELYVPAEGLKQSAQWIDEEKFQAELTLEVSGLKELYKSQQENTASENGQLQMENSTWDGEVREAEAAENTTDEVPCWVLPVLPTPSRPRCRDATMHRFSSMKRRILYVPPALSTSRTWTVRRMRKVWSVPTSLRRAALNRRATRWRSTLTAKTISWSKVCCLTMKRTRIR